MVPFEFAARELEKYPRYQRLKLEALAFGGRFDAVYFNPG
jgi:hypothetical protein